MNQHHHHHRPRDPFGDRRRGYRDPFAGPGPRGGRRGRFAGGEQVDPATDRGYGPPFGPGDPEAGPGTGFGPGFGPGFAPGFGPGFGPGRGFGPEFGRGRGRGGHRGGRRAGRGDIRAAILLLLAEQQRHGYELIREITERTDGAWRPSPGAIYPALAMLEDEGLVTIAAEGGRRLASLSEAGRAYVVAHADELGDPFADATARMPRSDLALRAAIRGLVGAGSQVAQNGDEAQVARARAVLERATKDLYLVLAGQDPMGPEPTFARGVDEQTAPPAAGGSSATAEPAATEPSASASAASGSSTAEPSASASAASGSSTAAPSSDDETTDPAKPTEA